MEPAGQRHVRDNTHKTTTTYNTIPLFCWKGVQPRVCITGVYGRSSLYGAYCNTMRLTLTKPSVRRANMIRHAAHAMVYLS